MTNMIYAEKVIDRYAAKTNKQIERSKRANKNLFETVLEGYEALKDCEESLAFFKMKVKADRSTINKMISIARSRVVVRNLDSLPLSWNTLYTIASSVPNKVDEETFEKMLLEGIIKPSSSQKQVVEAIYNNSAAESDDGSSTDEGVDNDKKEEPLLIRYNPKYILDSDRERVDAAISILAECGFEVVGVELNEGGEK
jgi:hypothetical protein